MVKEGERRFTANLEEAARGGKNGLDKDVLAKMIDWSLPDTYLGDIKGVEVKEEKKVVVVNVGYLPEPIEIPLDGHPALEGRVRNGSRFADGNGIDTSSTNKKRLEAHRLRQGEAFSGKNGKLLDKKPKARPRGKRTSRI